MVLGGGKGAERDERRKGYICREKVRGRREEERRKGVNEGKCMKGYIHWYAHILFY
jgi:hypothetical protein